MTAGAVVITGGLIAAVILLTIVTVLCCCRLQYYCCKSDGLETEEEEEEEEEEEKPDLAKPLSSSEQQSNFPIFPHSLQPPSPPSFLSLPSVLTSPSPLSIISLPEHSSSKQLLTTPELYKSTRPANCRRYSPAVFPAPIHSYMFCPSCSGLLPFYLPREQELRNGGSRISYRTLEEEDVDLPSDISSFNQLNLLRSITRSEAVAHMSISTDV